MANKGTYTEALLTLCKYITTEELESLKFLAGIADGQSEKIKTPLQFISFIKKQCSNDAETVCCMIKLLDGIERPRLSQMIKKCMVCWEVTLERPVGNYVDCQKPQSQLREVINSNARKKIVALVGMLGIGKTELMKHICLELQDQYFVIQPAEGSAITRYHDVLKNVHSILKKASFDVQPDKASLVANMNDLKRHFVLSLDISKVPHTQNFCCNFKKFINEIQSTSYCKMVLITARYSCKNCLKNKNDIVNITLSPFNSEDSAKLLKKLIPDMESNQCNKLIDYCQGIPIQMELAAESWSQTLEPVLPCFNGLNTIFDDKAFTTHFNTFSQETKEILIYLSLFRDEFPEEFAFAVLEVEAQNARKTISFLKEEQLLLQRGDNYQVPWIIQHCISYMIGKDAGLKSLATKAKKSFIELLVEFLYGMNELFMGYTQKSHHKLFNSLLHGPANIKFGRYSPIKALDFYRRFNLSLEWVLKEGTCNMSLKAIDMVADCANECVSFLAKAMEKSTIIFIFETMMRCKRIKRNKARNASTLVSIAFLKMYHNGCHSEPEVIEDMLKKAQEDLLVNGKFESTSIHFHIWEVIAHCHTKLGHVIAANHPDKFEKGLGMIQEGIRIREKEAKQGLGSNALIAAGFVDVGKAYAHQSKYKEAKRYYEKALVTYKQELEVHPFISSTMRCLAEVYIKLGDEERSTLYALLAKNISTHILGDHHLDTARSLQKYAGAIAVTNTERAKELYKSATKIGPYRMENQELGDILEKCAELCDEEEAGCLHDEARRIRRRVSVGWNPHINVNDARPLKNEIDSYRNYSMRSYIPYVLLLCILLMLVLACISTIPNCRN